MSKRAKQKQDLVRLAKAMWPDKEWITRYPRGAIIDGVFHHPVPSFFTDANAAWAVHQHMMASDKAEDYKDALFERVVRPGHQYSRAQDVTPWDWPHAALTALGGHTKCSTT